jgi:small-conductance mechanosensitive channel
MKELFNISEYVFPVSTIIGAILLGIVFEKIILNRIHRLASKTKWEGDDIIVSSLKGMIFLWILIAAISTTTGSFRLEPYVVHVIDKLLIVIIIFSICLVVARIAVGFIKFYSNKRSGGLPAVTIFTNITRVSVLLIGTLIILESLGISITPILTALGVGGLAVALALQDTLSNFFSGIHILVSRQIVPGNFVKLETGEEGYVVDINWRTTTIRQLPNNIVIIPNSKLASAIVVNYYMPDTEVSVSLQVSVSYKSDLDKVEKVTIDVAKEVMHTVYFGKGEGEQGLLYRRPSEERGQLHRP